MPVAGVAEFAPGQGGDVPGLYRFQLNQHDFGRGWVGGHQLADQEVLLFVYWRDCRPFAKQ